MMKKPFYLLRMIALLFFGGTVMANVNDPNDYTFLQELTSLQGSTTGWQNISYSGSQVGTTEFLMVSFSHGNPSCSQMNHIYKHKVQGGGWIKAVTAGNDDKSMEIWIREVTSANRTNQGQIDTGGAGAVHAGITVYDGLAQVTNTADVTQCNTTTIAINNNGSGPFLVVAASDNGTPESNKAMFHFSPGDDRVFIYLTTDQNFSDNTTGSLRGAIASLSLQDVGTSGTNIASFVSQSVPTSMNAGETATVSLTMQNTGTSTWTKSAQHKLGSQNPQDNTDWGMNRVFLDDADNIAPNDQKVFTFDITAPAVAGTYNFQWKMVQEGVEWFGNQSANVAISVNSSGSYLDDCDALTGWSSAGGNSLTLSGTVKQGSNSVKMIGSGTNEFQKVFSPSHNSGLTPSNARLEFWYYVSDPSRMSTSSNQVELGSGGAPDVNEYHWTLSSFTAGWNFVSLDVSAAGITGGTPDLSAINWFRIYNAKSGSVTNRIDAIELVQTGNAYLDDCDALTGWSTTGSNSLSLSGTVKQGSNSVKMTGSGTNEFQKVFSPAYNSGLTPSNARLEFWYYVSDPSRMSTSSNQVELGSGGAADVNEYNWNLTSFTTGWNFISLDVSAAGTTGGTPDLNAINWFRIYNSKSGSVTNRIDAIRLIDKSGARVSEVGEVMQNEQILIYPNPATDYIVIDADGADLTGARVSVYTVTGQLASEYRYDGSSQWKLPLTPFKPGIHLLKIHVKGGEFTQRIVIK